MCVKQIEGKSNENGSKKWICANQARVVSDIRAEIKESYEEIANQSKYITFVYSWTPDTMSKIYRKRRMLAGSSRPKEKETTVRVKCTQRKSKLKKCTKLKANTTRVYISFLRHIFLPQMRKTVLVL